jgi:transcriptional regulator with XRE-family HTH domain
VIQHDASLATFLQRLREKAGLSLRDVERATAGAVSNVYLSQLENGKRLEPSPRMLVALARVYQIPVKLLFEKAGYVDAPAPDQIETAFRQVLADPGFQFGTGFPGGLDDASKRTIVRLYELATGKNLLTDDQ